MLFSEFFLIFFFITILSTSSLLLFVENPIHSLVLLIVVFLNASGILIIFNFDFIALLLIIIYVGALAVLFLFILMMLDIHFIATFKTDWFVFVFFSSLLSIFLFSQTFNNTFNFLACTGSDFFTLSTDLWVTHLIEINNCATFGYVLYNHYMLFFLLAGLILLLALLGAVKLTYITKKDLTTFNYDQLSKTVYISIVK